LSLAHSEAGAAYICINYENDVLCRDCKCVVGVGGGQSTERAGSWGNYWWRSTWNTVDQCLRYILQSRFGVLRYHEFDWVGLGWIGLDL